MLSIEGDVDPKGLRAVKQLILDEICGSADYCQKTASTNTLGLADLHSKGVVDEHCPKLYLTDLQTAGRGRHGRDWVSTQGTLTFSLVIDRSRHENRSTKLLSLAVGVGVARCLEFEFAPLQVKLKWPNDVCISGGKVAGILLETTQHTSDRVVIGVGVNVSEAPDLCDDPSSGSVRSLATAVGRRIHRYRLLQPIVVNILRAMDETLEFSDDLVAEFRSRCLLIGQVVSFQSGGRSSEGTCKGVTDHGDLIVATDTGVRHLQSGEVCLVRMRCGD